jgi:hypothetical protein
MPYILPRPVCPPRSGRSTRSGPVCRTWLYKQPVKHITSNKNIKKELFHATTPEQEQFHSSAAQWKNPIFHPRSCLCLFLIRAIHADLC